MEKRGGIPTLVGCPCSLGSVCPCPSFMVTLGVSGSLRGTSGQLVCRLLALTAHCFRRIQVKSSAVEALQKSHIENIAAFLGKSSSQATGCWAAATGNLTEGKRVFACFPLLC